MGEQKKDVWTSVEVNERNYPQHSDEYIDINFITQEYFIYSKGHQESNLTFDATKQEISRMKHDIVKGLKLTIKNTPDDIIRICFDFGNDVVKVKDNHGVEANIYYMKLKDYQDTILKAINAESMEAQEMETMLEATIMMHEVENLDFEEKCHFFENVIRLRKLAEEQCDIMQEQLQYIKELESKQKKDS